MADMMALRSTDSNRTSKHSGEYTNTVTLQDVETGATEENRESDEDRAAVGVQLVKGTVLATSNTNYIVKGCKGKGAYGTVAHCVDMTTNTPVAIKMFTSKDTCFEDAEREFFILGMLSKLSPDTYNLIRLHETLLYDLKPWLVFELLDRSLLDFVKGGTILSVVEIRPIAQQLLVALAGIKSLGIVHTELGPENVMLVNHRKHPFKVKLIDFGDARPTKIIKPGSPLQKLTYRAPEVMLGLPVSEAIDMWSLGCVLVYLYLGFVPFPGICEYDVMKHIIDAVGMPDSSLLETGRRTEELFKGYRQRWDFKSPEEYEKQTGVKISQPAEWFSDLDDIKKMRYAINNPVRDERDVVECENKNIVVPRRAWKQLVCPPQDAVVAEDTDAFINFLQQMFMVEPQKRIVPEEALKHSFLTMDHLCGFKANNPHIEKSAQAMLVCQPPERVSNIPELDLGSDTWHYNIPSGPSGTKNKAEGTKMSRVKKFFSRVV